MPNESQPPLARLSAMDADDLEVVIQTVLQPDTRLALEKDFPPEQLPDWQAVERSLKNGWILLHELRSRSTGELLTARLLVDYPSEKRGDTAFVLVSFVVTPDGSDAGKDTKQGKSRGYGSYLRQPSFEITRRQKPHAVGLVAERESPAGSTDRGDQRVKRANWMKQIGVLKIEGLGYEIPPFVKKEEQGSGYIPVGERLQKPKPADLLLTRFNNSRSIEGKSIHSIVSRLYLHGYGISHDDQFFIRKMETIDPSRTYSLVEE